jgi:CDP-diacylglycerol--glycerol-3-phosphate 3-phosphatidyltransferase
MTLYDLKPRFQALLRPFVGRLAGFGVTANQVTVGAAIVSIGIGGYVAMFVENRSLFVLIPIWLFLRMALNAIDGMLAREHDQSSPLGAYLNELTDVVSDAALYLPFAFIAPFSIIWIGLVIFLAALSEFAGALGPMIGVSRQYTGPFGKSDRALIFGALALWTGLGLALPPWLSWLMPAVAILLCLTIINRVRAGVAEARSRSESSPA